MIKFWRENSLLVVCTIFSIVLLSVFSALQIIDSSILKLETKWLLISGAPLLVALIAGGYIAKFKGFGIELESKLNSPVKTLTLKATDVIAGIAGDNKQSVDRLPNFTDDQIERTKRLSFISGRDNYYGTDAIIRYMEKLRNLEYLEVKTESGEFICLLPASEFKSNNENRCNVEISHNKVSRFRRALEENKVTKDYSHVCIKLTVGQDEGLLDVLQKLRNINQKIAVVVNSDGQFIGILTERDIEHRIADDVLYSKRA